MATPMFERNPYLSRTHENIPHTYSFDIQTGKYYLEHSGNIKTHVHKTGKMINRFIPQGSGFFSVNQRYQHAKKDKSAMHYTPDFTINKHKSLYTPITNKFVGYAQYPYKELDASIPEFLTVSAPKTRRVIESMYEKKQDSREVTSTALDSSPKQMISTRARRSLNEVSYKPNQVQSIKIDSNNEVDFFELSMNSMVKSRPLPKRSKKTCYSNKCRVLEQLKWATMRSSTDEKTKTNMNGTAMNNTLNKSLASTGQWGAGDTMGKGYFQRRLQLENSQIF